MLDKDTKKVLRDGEKVKNWVNGDDWKYVKEKLFKLLVSFDSIDAMDSKKMSPEEIGKEVLLRQAVIQIIMKWMQSIEGEAAQYDANKSAILSKYREEDIIKRL